MWECYFYATLWSIWIARNDVIFNNKAANRNQVVELTKTRAALWIKARFDIKVYTVENIKRNLDGARRLIIQEYLGVFFLLFTLSLFIFVGLG
ncbi:hypothetical protein RHGRI_022072 [Rhododendron griersonianum]|uniref:Uncharacterized protein n=1 Tax=Rhododendron griersonianum TaxID=479676 RepID=A0AAV6JQN7_9ERIC|nr:hypothetical protein RHGRI_022072 [Rhododendron griersonianum]